MNEKEIHESVLRSKEYFLSGKTQDLNFRIHILKEIKRAIKDNLNELFFAFKEDFNKCEFDVITTEVSMVFDEIDYFIKNIKKLQKPCKTTTNLINLPGKSYIIHEPYGLVLIVSPWNYPFQLSLIPLIGAIASGNTVILKPSSYSLNVSKIIFRIFENINNDLIKVILGGREENESLLKERFDYIFFTGSPKVGKKVYEEASKNLTKVTLELGGKSPCIFTKNCDLKTSVRRLAWGKFLNAGQTCVAPDYLLVEKNIKNEVIELLKITIKEFYYKNGVLSLDFTHIINNKHKERLEELLKRSKIIFGGKINGRQIEPTLVEADFSSPIMEVEIFGPILPIIEYENLDEIINILKEKEKPLALYIFSNNKEEIQKIISNISSGGISINDTVMHLANPNLPFGGVGNSGIGNYHHKYSFETFTHTRSVYVKNKFEFKLKYPPYTNKNLNLIRKIFKI